MFTGAAYGFLALLLLSLAAFWPRYLSRLGEPTDVYTHLHALFATVWCLLLIVQPLLVRRSRELHRRVGLVSYAIAPGLVVASILLAHYRFRTMDEATFRQEAGSLFLPVSAVILFTVSFALAIRYRKTMPLHARFMIASGLPMIDPVLGRVLFYYGPKFANPLVYQAITFGLTDVIVLLMILRPRIAPRLRAAYAAPAAIFPVAHIGWFTLAQGELWLPFAAWFRSLPLTMGG